MINIYNPKMSLYEFKNKVEDFMKIYQNIVGKDLKKISL